jgi:hypothetical protein
MEKINIDKEYVFTFGQGHDNGYVVIKADNSNDARDIMVDKFGKKWSMQYDAPNARQKAGVKQFGLREVKK